MAARLKRPSEGRTDAHPLYRVWRGMRARCLNPKATGYANYGGRGITVAPAWDDFWTFVDDMGPRPDGFQLERRDNSGPYTKDNCLWASRTAQGRNKRNNVLFTAGGVSRTAAQWAGHLNINVKTLKNRLYKLQWPVEKALGFQTVP